MFADFDAYGGAVGLTSCCLYGGDPYAPQEHKLKRGVDIVVGTPGRIKVRISLSLSLSHKFLKLLMFFFWLPLESLLFFVCFYDRVIDIHCRIILKDETLI